MAALWGELMSFNVSYYLSRYLGSVLGVEGDIKDRASEQKKGFFYTHWGLPSARQPGAAPWFVLAAPFLSFRVQCMMLWEELSHACRGMRRGEGETAQASELNLPVLSLFFSLLDPP